MRWGVGVGGGGNFLGHEIFFSPSGWLCMIFFSWGIACARIFSQRTRIVESTCSIFFFSSGSPRNDFFTAVFVVQNCFFEIAQPSLEGRSVPGPSLNSQVFAPHPFPDPELMSSRVEKDAHFPRGSSLHANDYKFVFFFSLH